MHNDTQSQQTSFFEIAHDKLNGLYQNTSWSHVVHYSLLIVGGMALGFIIKKCGKALFYGLLGTAIALGILVYYKIIFIDWTTVDALGLLPASTFEGALRIYARMAQKHIVSLGLITFGFLVGYKMA